MNIKSYMSGFMEDPVSLEQMNQPVILIRCGHRIDQNIAIDLFGSLNSANKVTKPGKCPECRGNVDSYIVDIKIKELSSFLLTSFTKAQCDAAEDKALHELGAKNGNINSMYLLGEFYVESSEKKLSDLKTGIEYIQTAAQKDHAGAKDRLFVLYFSQKLHPDTKIDRKVLKACITRQKKISNTERLQLGSLLEKGYGFDEPDNAFAFEQYEIAFYNKAPEASSRILAIFQKIINQISALNMLLNNHEHVYATLTAQELIKLIFFAKELNSDFLSKLIGEIVLPKEKAPGKTIEVALAYYQEDWAQKYLKSQVTSKDLVILKQLAEAYFVNHAHIVMTKVEAVHLVNACQFPNNHIRAHFFLGEHYAIEKQYENAIRELTFAATCGDLNAMVLLADMYEKTGQYSLAFEWYDKAAEQNHVEGLYKRGRYRQLGVMGEINNEQAIIDFKKSLALGCVKSLIALIEVLCEQKEYAEVYTLLKQSNNSSEAKSLEGICFLKGYHVEQNSQEADRLFNLATTDLSYCLIALAYLGNDEANVKVYADKILVRSSDPMVHYFQGQLYETSDLYESIKFYKKAALEGLWEARKKIAELFLNRKIPNDVNLSLSLFESCFEVLKPNVVQMTLKAVYLCTGLGLESKNVKKGLKILADAIRDKNTGVIEFVAELFTNDLNNKNDRVEAYQILKDNKVVYLSSRSVNKIAEFLKVVHREGQELEDWMTQIKRLAPPAFLDQLCAQIGSPEMNVFANSLKWTSYGKKAKANCIIL